LQYPPATRRRGAADTRRRRRQPGRYRDQNPYQSGYGGYGYGGPVDRYGQAYRSQGQYNRAQLVRTARRVHATAKFTAKVIRGGYRHRRRLAGAYALSAIAGLGLAASLMPSGVLVAGIAGGGQLAYGALKHRAARRREDARKLTTSQVAGWAARLATAAWLPLTAAFGFADPLRLMLAAGSAIALPWWAVHTRPSETPLELEEPERVGDEEIDPVCARWLETVGAPGGMLSGSYLVDPQSTDDGWESVLQLVPGKQRPEAAISATDLIAGAYGVDPTRVTVTRLPDGRNDRAFVAVHYVNPLQEVRAFTAPSLDKETGWVTIGVYADGTPARWRLYEPGSGPCGGLIFGAQGSGKSSLVNQLATEITQCGFAVLWLGDGQEGASLPDWVEQGAAWYGYSLAENRRMLQAAERVLLGRQKRRKKARRTDERGRSRRGYAAFDATEDEPYLFVVVDEWHKVGADPECRRIGAFLLSEGRKLGGTLIVIDQIPSVARFGNDDAASTIRSLSSTTNVAMFRTARADKSSHTMGGMNVEGVDPTAIPTAFPDGSATQGLGFLAAPGGQVAIMRSNWVRDPLDWSAIALGNDLESDAVEAAGENYATWRERLALVDDGEDDPADVAEREEKAERDATASPLARIPAQATGAHMGQVVAMPQNQQLNPRDGALSILRGTGQIMSTAQVANHVNALTGSEHSRDAVQAALRRALADGEVVQYPALPTGKDRSARWQAAEHAIEERHA
jgi:hypothetical protein